MKAVIAENISKQYNGKPAVEKVSFEVDEGEIFGLIGPDGAGKTSIFRILTTLLLPDGGSAQVHHWDVVKDWRAIRNAVGYMPGKFSLYQDLTVEENLHFFATVFNTSIQENYHLIEEIYVQLEPFKNRRAGKLSGGMKQKLALCCALIHKPKVLFLDEPTTGVDPVSRREFWEMLKKLKQQNISIVVSTPYMDEASMCDRIALIQSGSILSIDTPQDLVKNYGNQLFKVKANDRYKLLEVLKSVPSTKSYAFGEYAHISVEKGHQMEASEIRQHLHQNGLTGVEIGEAEVTIEDCFINLLH
ncbi:MAG: ABC transporter ATP-binding protein [Bacteroidota bacterium]|nr:ABC transporter ATP-binding protein [Bacteroidota bacterium]